MNSFILLLIGLLLIFLEFFIPGAILGIIGGLFVISSVIVFALQSGSIVETIVYIIATFFCLWGIIRFALWRIPRANSSFSIYLKGDQEGFVASSFEESTIGKRGVVLTDLKPGGYIVIEGKQEQAISNSGYITKGEEVEVIGGEGDSLIVQRISKN